MVDPIGQTPVKTSERIAPVARVASPVAAASVATRAPEPTTQLNLTSTVKELAAKPPVDLERVAKIRKAIEDGNFPIYPAKIADRLIALRLDWNPNDAS